MTTKALKMTGILVRRSSFGGVRGLNASSGRGDAPGGEEGPPPQVINLINDSGDNLINDGGDNLVKG